jgi:hypothetical protein
MKIAPYSMSCVGETIAVVCRHDILVLDRIPLMLDLPQWAVRSTASRPSNFGHKIFGAIVKLGRHIGLAIVLLASMHVMRVHAATTLWMHNGSVIELEHQGDLRRFYYYKPREAFTGTLLFTGWSTGTRYIGRAYFFNPRCGRGSYEVKGPILDNHTRVVLEGRAPRIGEDCKVHGYFIDRLEFNYLHETVSNPVDHSPSSPVEHCPGRTSEAVGTGFFVATLRVLTNYHVIDRCAVLTLLVPGGSSSRGRVVAGDPTNDLALVALSDNALAPFLSPNFRTGVRVGEAAFAYGYPQPGLLSSSGNFTSKRDFFTGGPGQ